MGTTYECGTYAVVNTSYVVCLLVNRTVAHIFCVTVQVVYGGTSQARTVILEHEFYLPRGHNGVPGETKQDRIKFDVILTSSEIIEVDTAVLKPIKWKCMVLILSYYTFYVFL